MDAGIILGHLGTVRVTLKYRGREWLVNGQSQDIPGQSELLWRTRVADNRGWLVDAGIILGHPWTFQSYFGVPGLSELLWSTRIL